MNYQSRIINTLRNSIYGIIAQGVLIFLNFLTRTVFLKFLSTEYLGVNGLFSNVLSMLSLVELGIGTAIVYSMYKPIAENNKREISALMSFYKKAYHYIGIVVTILGLLLVPFLDLIVKNKNNIQNLEVIYLLFLFNTSLTYFYAYKRSIISADQKEYILSKYRMYFSFLKAFLQIAVLFLTKNFIIYVFVQIFCTFLENFFISRKADKMYSYLKEYKNEKIAPEKVKKIKDDVKSLTIYKISGTMLDGTDNIIISSFLDIGLVGLLSNYTLIVNSINMLLTQVVTSVTASVGNFIVKEDNDRCEELLHNLTFVQFIFYGFSFVSLACLLNPFITLWIGKKYLFDLLVVFIIALNFFISGILSTIWTFRTTMGLFKYGKYRPIFTAILNLVISVILANEIGILGVLLGTTISRVCTNVWFDPYIVYKHGLHKKFYGYLRKLIVYIIVCILDIILINYIIAFFGDGLVYFVLSIIVTVIVFFVSCLFFYKTNEFKYLLSIVRRNFIKFNRKE
ncbi:hypothetical protein [Thomasclavelia spiroformis]|uniref:hypothetical protein n=1 Tax=Thomasclavelia spiroformis TaxID=29348 RepID=UPI00399B0697